MTDLEFVARKQTRWEDFLEMVGLTVTIKIWGCGGEEAGIDAIFDHQGIR